MPLPKPLQRLTQTRRFWTDFFWDTEAEELFYAELDGCKINLPVADGFALGLSLDPTLGYFSLAFSSPGNQTVEIAWDDQAHWHPHVLRWQELELICRAVAAQDRELAHPGIVLPLLQRFAPICDGDDLEAILPLLDGAWRQFNLFSDSEITEFIERIDARDAGFRWSYHQTVGGWCLEQEDERAARGLYTLRRPDNVEFPFRAWSEMLTEAYRVITGLESAAGESARALAEDGQTGMVAHTPHAGQARRPREKHALQLNLPLRDPQRPLPEAAARLIATTLDRILRDEHLGSAEPSSSTSIKEADGSYVTTEDSLSIVIKGDLTHGVELVRGVLWWVGAPASAGLSRQWKEEIPLGLAQQDTQPGETRLQISDLRTVQWRHGQKQCHRFDRTPFSDARRRVLRNVLAAAGAKGPDEDGWFILQLMDGGLLRLCFHRLEDDPDLDGGSIAVKSWSPQAAGCLYRLLHECEFMLLPMAVATTEVVANTVAAAWPSVRIVESPSDLYTLIDRGPYRWWLDRHGM